MRGTLVPVMVPIIDCLVTRNWLIPIMDSRILVSISGQITMWLGLNFYLLVQQDSPLKDFIRGIKIIQ